jgi:phage shock protein C
MTKRLIRPREGRMIGGVAAGIANYFGIDVTIIRVIWMLLLLPGGLPGFIPYVVLWILMPAEQ